MSRRGGALPAARASRKPLRPIIANDTRRGGFQPARRRAALGHPGGPLSDVSGFDGEVTVRFEAVYRRADPACGERRLLLAVLEDGIRTYLKYGRATHGRAFNLRREALSWLTAGDDDDVFAFDRICEALGIDASRLRHRVLKEAVSPQPLH